MSLYNELVGLSFYLCLKQIFTCRSSDEHPRPVVPFKLFFTEPLKFRTLPKEKQVEISEMVAVKRFANERK